MAQQQQRTGRERERDSVSKSYVLLHILLLTTLHDPEYVCAIPLARTELEGYLNVFAI